MRHGRGKTYPQAGLCWRLFSFRFRVVYVLSQVVFPAAISKDFNMVLYRFAKPLMLGVCLAALSGGVSLRVAEAESLDMAVKNALNNNPQVRAAMANRDSYVAERKQEFSAYYPTVSVGAAGGGMYGDNATSRGLTVSRGSAYSSYAEGTLNVRQMLFDGFGVQNKVEAAQARREAANYTIEDTRENLALRTVMSYLGILRGQETLAEIDKQMALIKEERAKIENMVAKGAADESMAVQAQDIQLQLEKSRADTRKSLDEMIAEYREVTGETPDLNFTKPVPRLDLVPDNVEDAVKLSNKTNPALLAETRKSAALTHDMKAEEAAYYPDLSGELSYMNSNKKEVLGGKTEDAKALVRVSWNFSTGGETKARVQKSKARYQENMARYDALQRQLEHGIRKAYSDRATIIDKLSVMEKRADLQRKLLDNYQSQFEGARVNLLQLMQAKNALFNADIDVLNGKYQLLAAQYAILASMGRLQDALNVVAMKSDE